VQEVKPILIEKQMVPIESLFSFAINKTLVMEGIRERDRYQLGSFLVPRPFSVRS